MSDRVYEVMCCRNVLAENEEQAITKFIKAIQGANNLDAFDAEENDDWEEGDDIIK